MVSSIISSSWKVLPLLLLLFACTTTIVVSAKEIIATYEWQRVGPTDTLPAGLEIRMDLSGGGKWARLPPKELDSREDSVGDVHHNHTPRCGPSCKERQQERAAKRRAAGFLLREPKHSGREMQELDEELNIHSSSVFHQAGVFVVGLGIGLAVATRVRKRSGLHEH